MSPPKSWEKDQTKKNHRYRHVDFYPEISFPTVILFLQEIRFIVLKILQCVHHFELRHFGVDHYLPFAQQVGNETTAHLVLVKKRLVTYFAPCKVLSQQARYIRHYMRKPTGRRISTRQYVSAIHVLNNMIQQLPPAFEANQKILDPDLMDILVSQYRLYSRQHLSSRRSSILSVCRTGNAMDDQHPRCKILKSKSWRDRRKRRSSHQ